MTPALKWKHWVAVGALACQPVRHQLPRRNHQQGLTLSGKLDTSWSNNAGIIRRCGLIDFSEKDWDDVIDLNLKTVFFLSQAVAKQFIKQGTGAPVINVASIGVLSFQGGVRVPSTPRPKVPSWVSGVGQRMGGEGRQCERHCTGLHGDRQHGGLACRRCTQCHHTGAYPCQRWGLPSDLAGPVVFLASKASDYVMVTPLAVDGGWLAR